MTAIAKVRKFAKLAFWPVLVISALNIETLAAKLGWDQLLIRNWSPAMSEIVAVLQTWWIQVPSLLLLGGIIGGWLVNRLKKVESQQQELIEQRFIDVTPTPNATPSAEAARSPDEIKRQLAAVDTALDILFPKGPLAEHANGANSLRAIWAEQAATPEQYSTYRASLSTNRERFREAMRGLSDAIEAAARYPEITSALEAVKAKDYQTQFDEFADSYKRVEVPVTPNQRHFFEGYDKRLRAAILAFKTEIDQSRSRLLLLHRQLSSSEPTQWAAGVVTISIKNAASAFAGISPKQFDGSDKAQAIAQEIRHYVASGKIPRAEDLSGNTIVVASGANYGKHDLNDIGYDQMVHIAYLRSEFERRAWDTSWLTLKKGKG